MRQLFIGTLGLLILFVCTRRGVSRRERAKLVAIGLGLLVISMYQGMIRNLSVTDVLLLRRSFNSTIDVTLVEGYGVFVGAVLSMLFPVRARLSRDDD